MTPSSRIAGPFLALLAGAAAIGFVPLVVRESRLDASAIAFWRVTLSLPLFLAWAYFQNRTRHRVREGPPGSDRPASGSGRGGPSHILSLPALLIPGFFFAADLSSWHVCIRWTSVANATLLANFTPVWMTLAGWIWFRERPSGGFLAGAGIALAGAALLLGADLGKTEGRAVQGDFIGLMAAVFYTGYLLTVKRLRGRHSTASIMAGSAVGCALALLPLMLLHEEHVWPADAREWALMTVLAWFCHALGQGLIAWALPALPAGVSAVGLLVQVFVAAATGLMLGEGLAPVQFLGGAVLLAGIWQARRKGI